MASIHHMRDPRDRYGSDAPFHLPMPGVTDPIRLSDDLPAYSADGLCLTCHEPHELHRDTTGYHDIGHDGALLRRTHGILSNARNGVLEAPDLFPELTEEILVRLQVDCGPAMAWAAHALFTPSELRIIARKLANSVIAKAKRLEDEGRVK